MDYEIINLTPFYQTNIIHTTHIHSYILSYQVYINSNSINKCLAPPPPHTFIQHNTFIHTQNIHTHAHSHSYMLSYHTHIHTTHIHTLINSFIHAVVYKQQQQKLFNIFKHQLFLKEIEVLCLLLFYIIPTHNTHLKCIAGLTPPINIKNKLFNIYLCTDIWQNLFITHTFIHKFNKFTHIHTCLFCTKLLTHI